MKNTPWKWYPERLREWMRFLRKFSSTGRDLRTEPWNRPLGNIFVSALEEKDGSHGRSEGESFWKVETGAHWVNRKRNGLHSALSAFPLQTSTAADNYRLKKPTWWFGEWTKTRSSKLPLSLFHFVLRANHSCRATQLGWVKCFPKTHHLFAQRSQGRSPGHWRVRNPREVGMEIPWFSMWTSHKSLAYL